MIFMFGPAEPLTLDQSQNGHFSRGSPDDRAPADSRPVQQGEAQLRLAGVTLSWLSLTQLHLDRQGNAHSSMQQSTGTHMFTTTHMYAETGNKYMQI